MLKVCSNHSIVQHVDYMRGGHQRGRPGAVVPIALYKIHHWIEIKIKNQTTPCCWQLFAVTQIEI